jgi:hypothetical protein
LVVGFSQLWPENLSSPSFFFIATEKHFPCHAIPGCKCYEKATVFSGNLEKYYKYQYVRKIVEAKKSITAVYLENTGKSRGK